MVIELKVQDFSIYNLYDLLVMSALVVFFVGYINRHSDLVGLPHFLPTSENVEKFWEFFSWLVFAMLAFDIYLKYRKAENSRLFLRKHWLDLAMLAMIPLFAGLKIANVSIKLIKGLKMAKSAFKVVHSAKKVSKI